MYIDNPTLKNEEQAAAAQKAADDAERAALERRCNWYAVGIGLVLAAAVVALVF